MSNKRSSNQDPDYETFEDAQVKRLKLIEEDAKNATVVKICNIIRTEINEELNRNEDEVDVIDENLYQVRHMLDQLRAYEVTGYYGPEWREHTYSQDPSAYTGKIEESVNSLLTLPALPKDHSASRSQVTEKSAPAGSRVDRYKIKQTIIIGNVSQYISIEKREDQTSHKWKMYVRGPRCEPDISTFIHEVWFFLHPSYHPNLVVVKEHPFEIVRRGWGEFPVRVQLHFCDKRNKAVDIIHHLSLDKTCTGLVTSGKETIVNVYLETSMTYADSNSYGNNQPISTENCEDNDDHTAHQSISQAICEVDSSYAAQPTDFDLTNNNHTSGGELENAFSGNISNGCEVKQIDNTIDFIVKQEIVEDDDHILEMEGKDSSGSGVENFKQNNNFVHTDFVSSDIIDGSCENSKENTVNRLANSLLQNARNRQIEVTENGACALMSLMKSSNKRQVRANESQGACSNNLGGSSISGDNGKNNSLKNTNNSNLTLLVSGTGTNTQLFVVKVPQTPPLVSVLKGSGNKLSNIVSPVSTSSIISEYGKHNFDQLKLPALSSGRASPGGNSLLKSRNLQSSNVKSLTSSTCLPVSNSVPQAKLVFRNKSFISTTIQQSPRQACELESKPKEELTMPSNLSGGQCSLEDAVRWFVRCNPLVHESGEKNNNPCAKSKEEFLSWNIGKQKAAEWMRAKRVQKALTNFNKEWTDGPVWSTKRIFRWCQKHGYTPNKTSFSIDNLGTESSQISYSEETESYISSCSTNVGEINSVNKYTPVTTVLRKLKSNSLVTSVNYEDEEIDVVNSEPVGVAPNKSKHANASRSSAIISSSEDECLQTVLQYATERFAEDLLRESLSISSERGLNSPALLLNDVTRAVMHLSQFDFLTNKNMGKVGKLE